MTSARPRLGDEEPPVAERILDLVGGAPNVANLTHCYSRLRFVLHDDDAADDDALNDLPDVAIAVRQGGQLHVALRSNLVVVHDAIRGLMPG